MSRPLPTLSNMPWNVKQDIIDKMSFTSRLSVRKCCRELRDMIDKSRAIYPELLILVSDDKVKMCFISKRLEIRQNFINSFTYFEAPEDSCRVTFGRRVNYEKVVTGQHFIQRAISDIVTYMKSPRSVMVCISIGKSPTKDVESNVAMFFACLKSTLQKLPYQLNVFRLTVHFPVTQDQVLHILPFLNPSFLKIIRIQSATKEIDKLMETDQWKMAKCVNFQSEVNVRIQDLLHLRSFAVNNYRLVPEEVQLLIQSFLTPPSGPVLYRIGLPVNYNLVPIRTWLNANKTLTRSVNPIVWYTKIPGTQFHVYMLLKRTEFKIHRILSTLLRNA